MYWVLRASAPESCMACTVPVGLSDGLLIACPDETSCCSWASRLDAVAMLAIESAALLLAVTRNMVAISCPPR